MTRLALLRHAPTDWNLLRRLQGRADLPLSDDGRRRAQAWRLPDGFAGFAWVASPLRRCRETAETMAAVIAPPPPVAIEPRLAEMSFGEWEGMALSDLRHRFGETMAQWEAMGLDFRPPGGESPRDLQDRLRPWLVELAQQRRDTLAICHKGVIRALYALATGWTMERKAPDRLSFDCLQVLNVAADGSLAVGALNLPLSGHGKTTEAA
jgi:probable phosphoglycerate mutase